jgi:hypothetical protein
MKTTIYRCDFCRGNSGDYGPDDLIIGLAIDAKSADYSRAVPSDANMHICPGCFVSLWFYFHSVPADDAKSECYDAIGENEPPEVGVVEVNEKVD